MGWGGGAWHFDLCKGEGISLTHSETRQTCLSYLEGSIGPLSLSYEVATWPMGDEACGGGMWTFSLLVWHR